MSQSGLSSSSLERGGRRKKVFEYIKAANDLRQSYTSSLTTQISNAARDYNDTGYHDTPGAFPDVEIARHGDEEMVLFPSYGRRISRKKKEMLRQRRDSASSFDDYHGGSDEFEGPDPLNWEEYEIENAIVAIDVRGWIYAPHQGPMTRKNRLMIALARRLSGVPAPSSNPTDNSGQNAEISSSEKITSKGEDELVNKEMQSMINKAESEADAAWKSTAGNNHDDGTPGTPPRRTTTTTAPLDPSQMTKDELSIANAHLMERLRPFLANPMAEMPVTVFFFNDDQSQSRNILTDASGHFTLRAALPFVPTHIRVLGSENLSAAKEVRVVEPNGVSLISDIDDTIKHSAIANGAKEIFRNTFVRELSELVVGGVSEWYTQMAKLGVEIHYVSNAPWQLYPLLERFFKMVGLPPGSFHLKQYSGMLQGIFEPTAERKRASLERIMDDFPERKFVLVGDSGEADLEVYTDIVLANPGRILGIFIRDVTTTDQAPFFEQSVDNLQSATARSNSTGHLPQEDHLNAVASRPTLPPRRPADGSLDQAKSIDNADLIDLYHEEEKPSKPSNINAPPAKPSKPQKLRTASTMPDMTTQEAIRRKPAPPAPPAPRRSTPSKTSGQNQPSEVPGQSKRGPAPPPPRRTNTGTTTLGSQSSNSNNSSNNNSSNNNNNNNSNNSNNNTTTPATLRQQQSYPAAAASAAFQYASYASDRLWQSAPSNALRSATSTSSLNVGRASSNNANSQQNSGRNSPAPYQPVSNRREELWHRRWERASEILEKKGVVLGSWRVGSDVQDVCLWLTQDALKEMQQKSTTDKWTS